MIKALIFDLDGTLIHTTPEYRYLIVRATLQKLNAKDVPNSAIDKFWWGPYRNNIIKTQLNIKPEDFWPTLQTTADLALRKLHIKAYDDVHILRNLRSQGLKTAIVSGAPKDAVECELELINDKFDAIITGNHVHPNHKPDPLGLHLCVQELQIKPSEAMYIGNADEDILMAENAGMQSIIVDRKEHTLELQPKVLINSLTELCRIVGVQINQYQKQ